MINKEPKKAHEKDTRFFKPYEKYSNLLRTWLISYGVGAIAFLASQEVIVSALKGKEDAKCIVSLFMFGIGAQVIGAILYKYTMGIIYHEELGIIKKESKRFRFCEKVSESFILEFAIDLITIVTYLWASFLLVKNVIA